jgi:hypothetical protein
VIEDGKLRARKKFRLGPLRLVAVALFGFLAACSQPRGIKPGDTQVVAQWTTYNLTASTITARIERATTEARIGWACGNVCFVHGKDVGGSAYNIYLYTQDVRATVKLLVRLEQTRRLPRGLQIGIAKYKDDRRTDWTYAPAYPATLKTFDGPKPGQRAKQPD